MDRDEEISPKSDTITILSEKGTGDMDVEIFENLYDMEIYQLSKFIWWM